MMPQNKANPTRSTQRATGSSRGAVVVAAVLVVVLLLVAAPSVGDAAAGEPMGEEREPSMLDFYVFVSR